MISMDDVRIRVARGAQYLDQVQPDWWRRIDVGTLALNSCSVCVVGQLFGSYYWTAEHDLDGIAFGFSKCANDGGDRVWACLKDAWIEVIADRHSLAPFVVLAHGEEVGLADARLPSSVPFTEVEIAGKDVVLSDVEGHAVAEIAS